MDPSMSVFKQQDANGPFYPSIPVVACWTTWHRVFATPEDFGATYKYYNDALSYKVTRGRILKLATNECESPVMNGQ